ncbi:MAG: hypothetical protein L3J15_05870 [Devosiaceae bacterium]|nr:hypothetical protein [Devosiaceae bacterium]
MGFLDWLNPLKFITEALVAANKNKLEAQNDDERIKADVNIASLEAKRDVLISLASEPWWTPRSLMGYCVVILVAKLLVWDSAFGFGVTPDVGSLVTWITVTIIGFYFMSKSAETITQTIANAIAKQKSKG